MLPLLFAGSLLHAEEGDTLLQDARFNDDTILSDTAEVAPGGWFIRQGTQEAPTGEVTIDTEEGSETAGALRLTNRDPNQFSAVAQLITVDPHSNYMLLAKVKTSTLTPAEGGAGARLCLSEPQPPSRTLYASPAATSDSDWHELALYFNSGESPQFKVLLYLHQTAGTVWFDDVQLIKL